jgi:hypothetical protein
MMIIPVLLLTHLLPPKTLVPVHSIIYASCHDALFKGKGNASKGSFQACGFSDLHIYIHLKKGFPVAVIQASCRQPGMERTSEAAGKRIPQFHKVHRHTQFIGQGHAKGHAASKHLKGLGSSYTGRAQQEHGNLRKAGRKYELLPGRHAQCGA